jgi:chromosomal replication initiator protein
VIDTTALWSDFLKIVHEEVGSHVLETWFKTVTFVRWDAREKIAYLQAPNAFVKQWLLDQFGSHFTRHLARLLSEPCVEVVFLDSVTPSETTAPTAHVQHMLHAQSRTVKPEVPLKARVTTTLPALNTTFAFDSFVVGSCNEFAYKAATAVAAQPGALYSPLLICGSSGLGKTHLLHAIGNKVRSLSRAPVVLYQTAEGFVQEFIAAVRCDKVKQFQVRYKSADILLFDDVHHMAHKEQTQETFCSILASLRQARKQIVCSSAVPLRNLTGLTERMKSRLQGGLTVTLNSLSFEARCALVKQKAALHGVPLVEEVAALIARNEGDTAGELESAMIRLAAYASLSKQNLDTQVVQALLSDGKSPDARLQQPPELKDIAELVAGKFDYTLLDLRSTKRTKELVRARHAAMYLMKKVRGASLREIGAYFANRDHSTVLHACSKVEELLLSDRHFSALLTQVERELHWN